VFTREYVRVRVSFECESKQRKWS